MARPTAIQTPTEAYEGRLELTWTNKHRRLLAHEDGSYEWLSPSDYRVAEVRLLRDVTTVGAVSSGMRAQDNLLICGDALNALTSLVELPEFARQYAGRVKVAYLDPPFNTQQSFLHYDDALEHSVWLTMMRDRLLQIKQLLSADGSVWVHCDDSEQHRLRCVMDEVFGADHFKTTIVWQKLYARKSNTDFSTSHDYIVVYARNVSAYQRNLQPATRDQLARYKNPDNDPRGLWQSVSFHVRTDDPERRAEYRYEIPLPSGRMVAPPNGRHWNGKWDRFQQLNADNRLWFGQNGNSLPREKVFLTPDEIGLVPSTWWKREEAGDNDESKSEIQALFPEIGDPFQTPKPERLLQRVIQIASNPGDIVLDCFLGSGTTTAVAHKMSRRWIGIERDAATVQTYALPRLTKVVMGEDPGGITENADWGGGGGFRLLEVTPSMFSADNGGQVFLSEWVTNGKLAEVTAAQLHYEYQHDPPLCGKRGRSRLAVVDGLVNEDVARLLANVLADDERLCVCGTAVDPMAGQVLRSLRPGSSVRKIPQSILQEYRQTDRLRREFAEGSVLAPEQSSSVMKSQG